MTIDGIRFDEQLLSCDMGEPLQPIDKTKAIELDGNGAVPIVCDRKPQKSADGSRVFPRTEISVATNQGIFHLVIPPDGILTENYGSEIFMRIDGLRKQLDEKIASLKIELNKKLEMPVLKDTLLLTNEDKACPQGYSDHKQFLMFRYQPARSEMYLSAGLAPGRFLPGSADWITDHPRLCLHN